MNPPTPITPAVPDTGPAYALWIELATSVTSQRLHYRAGDEETAARNVFRLFGRTRELLAEHPQAVQFRALALQLLNTVLRPYTSRWHGWMTEGRGVGENGGEQPMVFRDEQVRRMFRTELAELQQLLRESKAGLAKLAGIDEPTDRADGVGANLGSDIVAGIGNQVVIHHALDGGASVIDQLNQVEHAEIRERRSCYGETSTPIVNATGLALSGGGIRSATFCLGIIQVLVRRNLFRDLDYLSTVSGGGYIGSFLSCALGSSKTPPTAEAIRQRIDDVFHRQNSGVESGLLRHLRNNSKYLLNGGIRAKLQIVGLLVSGILCNMLLVLPIPLFIAIALYILNQWGAWATSMVRAQPVWAPLDSFAGGALLGTALATGGFVLLLPAVQKLGHGQPPQSARAIFRRSFGWMAILAGVMLVAAAVFYVLPAIFETYERLRLALARVDGPRLFQKDVTALGAAGGGSVLLAVLASTLKSNWPRLKAMSARLFILSGPAFFLFILLLVGNRLGLRHTIDSSVAPAPWSMTTVLLVAVGFALWGWFLVNINTLSPHTYYRGKLCECYLARRRAEPSAAEARNPALRALKRKILTGESEQGRTEALQQVRLSQLRASQAAPYHLINTTLNVPASVNKELRGRNGDFFVVSKHYCGAPIVGYVPTAKIEASDAHFDLGTAMAVSGAAASTNMGWQTLPHFRFLMTLFNVRLGYWLRWPRVETYGGPGVSYFFREMVGAIHERSSFLNLSDGGHIENLAVYELLRRRVKFIVCVDGGMEPGMQCADLTRLQRYAEIDLGIRFEYATADLHLQPNGFSRSFAILVKIVYPPSAASATPELGWLIYIKLAVTGTEPAYVLDYRRENPAFPHQTTGDQFFDEAQFEAYRRLGECAAESLFRDELTAGRPTDTLRDWFQILANNLLADNDPVFRSPPAAVSAARGAVGRN